MSNRTIQTNDLAPNTTFMVRGHVTFSRVARHIEGEALQKDIDQKTRLGRKNIITKPYTTITICDAQVVFKNPDAVNDPSKRFIEEAYAMEAMFASSSAKNTGMCFTGVNKTKRLPWAGPRNPDNSVTQMTLEGELAAGMDVTLVLRVFADNRNNGVSLDGIILNEPVKYFTSVDLSAYGLTFVPNAEAATPAAEPEHAAPNQGQPVMPPTGDPYSSQPVQPAPGAPQVPPPTGYMPQQAAPGSGAPTGYPQAPGTAVPPAPAPAPGPYSQEPMPGGIRYDPGADPSRQY